MAIKRYVSLGKEPNYGITAAPQRYAEAIASIKPNQGWIIPNPIASREFRKRNLGPYRTRGSIGEFPVEPENIIGELLLAVFGSVNTSNPATGVYQHVFLPEDTLPSYTLRLGSEQIERVLPGGLVESLTVKFPHNDDLKARAEILSGFIESTASLATPTLSPLQALNMLLYPGTSVLKIGGVSKKNIVYDLEVTIKNNIPFDRGDLSGRTFSKKRYGQREVTGKVSAYFDDTTEYDRFIAGEEFKVEVRAHGPVFVDPTWNYVMGFDLEKCVYLRDVSPDIAAINEPLVVDAPFKAFYNPSVGYEARGILQNAISAY